MRGVVEALEQTATALDRLMSRLDPARVQAAVKRIEEAKRSMAIAGMAYPPQWRWAIEIRCREEVDRVREWLAGEVERG